MKKLLLSAIIGLGSTAVFAAGDAPVNFSDVDANQDGQISRQEAASFAAVEATFDKADANKDGALDPAEYSQQDAPEAPGLR